MTSYGLETALTVDSDYNISLEDVILKDRQQVITAVLPRSQLNAHCEFAPKPLYYYHI